MRLSRVLMGVTVLAVLAGLLVVVPNPVSKSQSPLPSRAVRIQPGSKGSPGPVHYQERVAVLMYHCVSPNRSGRGEITRERLEADLCTLKEHGYHFIPVAQMAAWLDGRGKVPPNAVVLTFDDGYRQFYDCVLPVLKKHRIPAILFVIGSYVGVKPAFLSWKQLRALEQSGLVTIGGHTFDQHYGVRSREGAVRPATVTPLYKGKATWETDREYQARLLADSRHCQQLLRERLGHTTPYYAYPYGAYTPELIRLLRESGFRYMFTVLIGTNVRGQDPARLYRIDAGKPGYTPRDLLKLLEYAALNPDRPQGPPPAWWPETWKE